MRRFGWTTVLACTALACGSATDEGESGAGDASAGAEDSGNPASDDDAGANGNGADPDCDGLDVRVLADDVQARSLRSASDSLFFVDGQAGPTLPVGSRAGAIRKVSHDGSASQVLLEGSVDFAIQNLWVDGETIYFLAVVPQDDEIVAVLYSMGVGGGEPTRVSSGDGFERSSAVVFGSDDEAVYVYDVTTRNLIVRVAKSDGAERVIADTDGLVSYEQTLVGDKVWFTASQGLDGIYSVPSDGSEAPQRFGERSCQSSLTLSEFGTFCGTKRLDDTGALAEDLTVRLGNDLPERMSAAYGEQAFLYSHGTRVRRIDQLNLRTLNKSPVACERGSVFELLADDEQVFWVEQRMIGGKAVRSVMSAARR